MEYEVQGVVRCVSDIVILKDLLMGSRHTFRFSDCDHTELAHWHNGRAHLAKDYRLRCINVPREPGLVVDSGVGLSRDACQWLGGKSYWTHYQSLWPYRWFVALLTFTVCTLTDWLSCVSLPAVWLCIFRYQQRAWLRSMACSMEFGRIWCSTRGSLLLWVSSRWKQGCLGLFFILANSWYSPSSLDTGDRWRGRVVGMDFHLATLDNRDFKVSPFRFLIFCKSNNHMFKLPQT